MAFSAQMVPGITEGRMYYLIGQQNPNTSTISTVATYGPPGNSEILFAPTLCERARTTEKHSLRCQPRRVDEWVWVALASMAAPSSCAIWFSLVNGGAELRSLPTLVVNEIVIYIHKSIAGASRPNHRQGPDTQVFGEISELGERVKAFSYRTGRA